MESKIKEKNFSLWLAFKTIFSNEDIENEEEFEEEIKQIKKEESNANIKNLEKMVEPKAKRGRKLHYKKRLKSKT